MHTAHTPFRVVCEQCGATPLEALPWADRYQRDTRLQHHLALEAASMPTVRAADQYGLSWSTVRRAGESAIARWEAMRSKAKLHQVGVNEKYLGRRHSREENSITIVSNPDTGEPLWIGHGRKGETLKKWLITLGKSKKKRIVLRWIYTTFTRMQLGATRS